MSVGILILGIVLLFCALNPFWLIVAIANFLVGEVYRRKEDKKTYSVAAVLSVFYIARFVIYYFIL